MCQKETVNPAMEKCGCTVSYKEIDPAMSSWEIKYCLLHRIAPELLEVLKNVKKHQEMVMDGNYHMSAIWNMTTNAISRATAKETNVLTRCPAPLNSR